MEQIAIKVSEENFNKVYDILLNINEVKEIQIVDENFGK